MDLAERVFSALPAEPVYAVLDGARDRRIRGFVIDARTAGWCLYRGKLPASLENAAPWLLRLIPGAPYTNEFFRRGWGQSWGCLLSSAAPSRELRRHLRKLLIAKTEDGKRLLFRWYDPRVLRLYLPTCTAEETATFFGPISAFAVEKASGGLHRFTRSEGGLEERRLELS